MKYLAETKNGQTIQGVSVQDVHAKARTMDAAIVKITAIKDDGRKFVIQNR